MRVRISLKLETVWALCFPSPRIITGRWGRDALLDCVGFSVPSRAAYAHKITLTLAVTLAQRVPLIYDPALERKGSNLTVWCQTPTVYFCVLFDVPGVR